MTRLTVGAATLSALSVLVPSSVVAQHGPCRHAPGSNAAYDPKNETIFKGIVADVKTGRSALYWITQIHTMGLGRDRVQEKQLLLKTDAENVRVHLGPTVFLNEQKVEIRKGDALEVTGSRVIMGEAPVVLAREIRKGNTAWTLRDAAGQPLWRSVQTEPRGFWTTKKVVVAVAAVKVALLATVLRH